MTTLSEDRSPLSVRLRVETLVVDDALRISRAHGCNLELNGFARQEEPLCTRRLQEPLQVFKFRSKLSSLWLIEFPFCLIQGVCRQEH